MAAEKVATIVKSIVLSIAVILVLMWASDVAGRYNIDAKVHNVGYANYITFELPNGRFVAAYCDGEYAKGDKVILTMDDNATEYNPADDFIVAIERRNNNE